jgi:hypothetical protein
MASPGQTGSLPSQTTSIQLNETAIHDMTPSRMIPPIFPLPVFPSASPMNPTSTRNVNTANVIPVVSFQPDPYLCPIYYESDPRRIIPPIQQQQEQIRPSSSATRHQPTSTLGRSNQDRSRASGTRSTQILTDRIVPETLPVMPENNFNTQVQSNFNIADNRRRIHVESESNRAANTRRTYDQKEKLWEEFCSSGRFEDGFTVTPGKLALFLTTEVQNRRGPSGKAIQPSTVENWVCALINVYHRQVAMGTNNNPHPRDDTVKKLLGNMVHKKRRIDRENHVDRGVNHVIDGLLTMEQTEQFANFFLLDGSRTGNQLFINFI